MIISNYWRTIMGEEHSLEVTKVRCSILVVQHNEN